MLSARTKESHVPENTVENACRDRGNAEHGTDAAHVAKVRKEAVDVGSAHGTHDPDVKVHKRNDAFKDTILPAIWALVADTHVEGIEHVLHTAKELGPRTIQCRVVFGPRNQPFGLVHHPEPLAEDTGGEYWTDAVGFIKRRFCNLIFELVGTCKHADPC